MGTAMRGAEVVGLLRGRVTASGESGSGISIRIG
jgi:hypothetical protein